MANTENPVRLLIQSNMVESLWKTLLQLVKEIATIRETVSYVVIEFGEEERIGINQSFSLRPRQKQVWVGIDSQARPPGEEIAVVRLQNLYSICLDRVGSLTTEEQELLQSYLAYCFLPLAAHRLNRAIAVSHFAQSLDGKIATHSGDSKWIGNPGNLLHAHRMRAICDGIMIGTRTLANDRPSLTVRLVHGENPRRIVISSSAKDFSSLVNSCMDPVLVLGSVEQISGKNLDYKYLPSSNGHISCEDILRCLYQEGILSVYVEGGAETTSNFLKDNMLDVMQLHLSPQIFGSGISGIKLPEIEEVKEAIKFEHFVFLPVGDSYMFVGEPQQKTEE